MRLRTEVTALRQQRGGEYRAASRPIGLQQRQTLQLAVCSDVGAARLVLLP